MSSAGRPFGKYTLVEKIGSGGMAEIWRAELSGVDGFEKECVVKKILPRYAGNRSFITMFVHEAKVCSVLQHANVVQIFELGDVDGDYYIAMELVRGADLLQSLTQATHLKRRIPLEICLYLVAETCKGLGYAHQATDRNGDPLDIVHLDVSPANVLISFDGEVKITDFGVARASIEGVQTGADDRLKGKLGYMSPEQVTGKPIDNRSDLFSLGVILYELLTLKRLFLGKTDLETLSNIRDGDIEVRLKKHAKVIPPGVAEIIRRALSRNPDTRFQTAYEFEESLSRYLFDERLRVTPGTLSEFMRDLFSDSVVHTTVSESPETEAQTKAVRAGELPRRDESTRIITVKTPATGAEKSTYRFKNADNSVFGPVSFANLNDLFKTHCVSPDELISIDGGNWRRVTDVTSLFRLLPEGFGRETHKPDDAGEFELSAGIRLLSSIATAQSTGRLKVTHGTRLKQVYFRRGKPVHIDSNDKNELLGAMLVERGMITAAQLNESVTQSQGSDATLGDVLCTLGYLNPVQLFRILEEQFRERFVALLGENDARYEFYKDDLPGPGVIPFQLDPLAVATEAARCHVTEKMLSDFIKGKMNKVCRLVTDPPFGAPLLKLNPREYRFKAVLEGRSTTISNLIDTYGQDDETRKTLLFVLFLLHRTGHITFS